MTQTTATITVSIHARKRWFFWAAISTVVALNRAGIIKDMDAATAWLARHAMRLEVRKAQ